MTAKPADLLHGAHPKYKNRVLFNFMGDAVNPIIINKIKKDNRYQYEHNISVINVKYNNQGEFTLDFHEIKKFHSLISHNTKIYINAHGSAGVAAITTNTMDVGIEQKFFEKSAAEVAQFISTYVSPSFKINSQIKKFKISLLVCESGMATGIDSSQEYLNNSLASHLLYEFKKRGMHCVIAAKLGLLCALPGKNSDLRVINPQHKEHALADLDFLSRLDDRLLGAESGLSAAVKIDDIYGMQLYREYIHAIKNRFNKVTEEVEAHFYKKHFSEAKAIYEYKGDKQIISRAYLDSDVSLRDVALEVIQECIQLAETKLEQHQLQILLNFFILQNWNEILFLQKIAKLVESKIFNKKCLKKLNFFSTK